MPKPAYLQQPKGRNYEIRRLVDEHLRPYLNDKKELVKSLGTKEYKQAVKRYPKIFNEIQAKINKAEADYNHAQKIPPSVLLTLKDAEIVAIVEQWFNKQEQLMSNGIYDSLQNQHEHFDEWYNETLNLSRYNIDLVKGDAVNIHYPPHSEMHQPFYGYYNQDIEKFVLAPAGISSNLTLETYKKINLEMIEATVVHEQRNIKRLMKKEHIPV